LHVCRQLIGAGLGHVPNRNDAPWSCLKKLD
jgi:hypothetical protein